MIPRRIPRFAATYWYPTNTNTSIRRRPRVSVASQTTLARGLSAPLRPFSRTTATMSSSAAEPAGAEPSPNAPSPSTNYTTPAEPTTPALPPLTGHEFRQYNRLAEHMDMFHAHFRSTWNTLYTAASSGRRPASMSLKGFVDEGLSFVSHLETHHSIEETYIFPVLARKMPEFRTGKGNGAAELLRQHREIHVGMEALETYLRKCRAGELDLEMGVLKAKLDTWGTVLWTHLDQEVKTLGAENMRKYWTVEEIRRIPM